MTAVKKKSRSTLVCLRIILIVLLGEHQELAEAPLFEHTHQAWRAKKTSKWFKFFFSFLRITYSPLPRITTVHFLIWIHAHACALYNLQPQLGSVVIMHLLLGYLMCNDDKQLVYMHGQEKKTKKKRRMPDGPLHPLFSCLLFDL